MKLTKIPSNLAKKGFFTFTEAVSHGLTQHALKQLVKKELLEHVDRGLYQIPGTTFSNEDIYRQATKIAGLPSAICLWSALVFYDLTDEIDIKTWIWVPQTKRIRHTSIRSLRRVNPHWDIGIDVHEGYRMTSLDRTLVEAVAYQRYVGSLAAHHAIKRALAKKQTDLSNIINMAKKLNFFQRIIRTLEAYIE